MSRLMKAMLVVVAMVGISVFAISTLQGTASGPADSIGMSNTLDSSFLAVDGEGVDQVAAVESEPVQEGDVVLEEWTETRRRGAASPYR